jgi:hypothetical protein
MPKLLHLLAPYGLEVWKRDEADLTITTLRLGLCGYAYRSVATHTAAATFRYAHAMPCHVMRGTGTPVFPGES